MATFAINPFLGDINPGTTEGAKLYNKSIEAPDDKLVIQQKDATDIMTAFETDASNFGWGRLIGNVQVDDAGTLRHILANHREITLEMIQKHARTTWGNLVPWTDPLPNDFISRDIDPATYAMQRPHFYKRTRATVIAKRIEASFDKVS